MHLHLKAAFGGAGRLQPTKERKNSLSENKFTLLTQPPLPPHLLGVQPQHLGIPNPRSWKG